MMNCILPIIYFIYQFCPLFMMNRKSRLLVYFLCIVTSVHFLLIRGRDLGHALYAVMHMIVMIEVSLCMCGLGRLKLGMNGKKCNINGHYIKYYTNIIRNIYITLYCLKYNNKVI